MLNRYDPNVSQTERTARIWDYHGSNKQGYFDDHVKDRIRFFLSQRLDGHNLDLGGGWYSSCPGSTVLDISAVCLRHNPEHNKVRFDLENLADGYHLPFADNTFSSATMISSWQYLHHPHTVLKELERVLIPAGEVYIINGQGARLRDIYAGETLTAEILDTVRSHGYDTLVEVIPTENVQSFLGRFEFQSLCVAMPGEDLFGVRPSSIYNRAARVEAACAMSEHPEQFNHAYAAWVRRRTLRAPEICP